MLRVILATLHLLALGLGLGAVIARGTALLEPLSASSLQRALRVDAVWGIAAVLWLGTGAWRLLGGVEKPLQYYLHNHFFLAKMGAFVLVLVLEIGPMLALMRWRRALAGGAPLEGLVTPAAARRIAMVSHSEALLVVLMVLAATAMARGYGTAP